MPTSPSAHPARPRVSDSAWIAPGAVLFGDVTVGDEASVWYGTVIRADQEAIRIGPRTNLQDGVVLHTDPGLVLELGSGVSVGHRAVLHGCTIGDDVLVGMSATVLNGAKIGESCLIAAGAVILEGTQVPSGSLVAGVPGKVRRELTDEEREGLRLNATHYLKLAALHRSAETDGSGLYWTRTSDRRGVSSVL
jgi:carbonic anhydrase/acetyltransferase-like protein (isoleucine patch superfamily)